MFPSGVRAWVTMQQKYVIRRQLINMAHDQYVWHNAKEIVINPYKNGCRHLTVKKPLSIT